MFPGQCGNTAFFFKSQPDQFHFEFRGIVFPGKSFFSAHEVSTCKISGCLSYRILDSGPDGTQTTLTIRESVSKIGGKIGKRLGHEKQWSLHDLRRTLSTHLSDLGVEFYVVEQLLGHALPGVAGVYNRSKFMAKKLDALELWTTYLNSIAGADSKVTILKQKAG